jgi:lipopolysaccharide/colanic/teichoic acid biosynthesis glycosyltransferase
VRTASHDSPGVGSPATTGRQGLPSWGGWLREWSALWSRWPVGRGPGPGNQEQGSAGLDAPGHDAAGPGSHGRGSRGGGHSIGDRKSGRWPGMSRPGPRLDEGVGGDRAGQSPTGDTRPTRDTLPTGDTGTTHDTLPTRDTGTTRDTLPTDLDAGTTFPPALRSRSPRSGWALVGGPGSLSLTLLVSELIVLLAYLAVAAVIGSEPLAQALISGSGWGLREWLVVLWLLTVALFGTGGAYRQRLNLSVWEELPALGWRAAACLVGVVVLVDHVDSGMARDAVALLGTAGMGSHLAVRLGVFALLREARRSQRAASRTLVLGGGTLSFKTVELLDTHRELGLLVLGYLDDLPAPLSHGPAGWTFLGQVEDLPNVVERLQIQTIVVGFGSGSDALTAQSLRRLISEPDPIGRAQAQAGARTQAQAPARAQAPVHVFAVPRLFEFGRCPIGQDHAGPIPLTRVRSASRHGPRWAAKRAVDIAAAVVGLVVAGPLLAGLALAVRVECGPGPVVVGHEHVGRRGATMRLWRFRTARPGRGPGPVGRRLRGPWSWLGGLPMLWNLLTGEVSVVGPRPTLPRASQRLQRMLPHYEHRLQVRGGLIGPGAVSACAGDPPTDEAVLYDTAYVENWGLWTDATVLLHGLRRLLAKGVQVVRTW